MEGIEHKTLQADTVRRAEMPESRTKCETQNMELLSVEVLNKLQQVHRMTYLF